ncbi:MAG: hypothetical protein ACD_3C00172G0006 [uncultured bacterium (gcode 4)]|uniref:Uncharacterized protein n=1 Tax=uncultured bacterium (gcode 4) TaxID=1234023 RepID=K2GBX5_9BACT|nr:MAG: hypothetical protein ACD_3C00172G0006 [uncultured bacterium (gcode 4)]
MRRIVPFEFSNSLNKSSDFYTVFSFLITKKGWLEEYWFMITWLVTDENDIPWYAYIIYIPDLEEYLKKIMDKAWISFEHNDIINWAWWIVYLKDDEWNVFLLIQLVPKEK